MDKSKKGHSKLIIASSDPAENFKFIEETLNQVAFLIGVEIAEPRLDHITFGWDRIQYSISGKTVKVVYLILVLHKGKGFFQRRVLLT